MDPGGVFTQRRHELGEVAARREFVTFRGKPPCTKSWAYKD